MKEIKGDKIEECEDYICKLCKEGGFTLNHCPHQDEKIELSHELSWGDELVEKSFLSNILDGIDIADEQMGNKGGGTKAIRFALQSRIGIDLTKEREQAFNSGRASIVEWCVKKIEEMKVEELNSHWLYLVKPEQAFIKALDDILQALKNKEQ